MENKKQPNTVVFQEKQIPMQEKSPLPPPKETDFSSKQLSLFQDFLCAEAQKKDRSNLIDFWDAIPKYYISRKEQNALRREGFLPTAVKNFCHRGIEYTVKIRPALITVDGKDMAFYPSIREELVEDALRKLATKQGHGYLNAQRHGVSFTAYELREELKRLGHSYSHEQIIESIEILQNTTVEIYSNDSKKGSIVLKTSPITSSIAVSKSDYLKDTSSKWFVDFSLMVTQGINNTNYRQYNYGLMMEFKSQLTRYLHKRLSNNYVQASMINPYKITLETLVRDSGLLGYKEPRQNKRKLEKSLAELVSSGVLMYFDIEIIRGPRNSLESVKYTLTPSNSFVAEIKAANKRVSLQE